MQWGAPAKPPDVLGRFGAGNTSDVHALVAVQNADVDSFLRQFSEGIEIGFSRRAQVHVRQHSAGCRFFGDTVGTLQAATSFDEGDCCTLCNAVLIIPTFLWHVNCFLAMAEIVEVARTVGKDPASG